MRNPEFYYRPRRERTTWQKLLMHMPLRADALALLHPPFPIWLIGASYSVMLPATELLRYVPWI